MDSEGPGITSSVTRKYLMPLYITEHMIYTSDVYVIPLFRTESFCFHVRKDMLVPNSMHPKIINTIRGLLAFVLVE